MGLLGVARANTSVGVNPETFLLLLQAKWVAYKLYRHARDYFDRQQPAEKRIIEYLCSIPDPAERRNQLGAALTPGPTRCVGLGLRLGLGLGLG
jgi:hypothetical protein